MIIIRENVIIKFNDNINFSTRITILALGDPGSEEKTPKHLAQVQTLPEDLCFKRNPQRKDQ